MRVLSSILFVAVILAVNDFGDAIIDKMVKQGANKIGDAAKTFSKEVIGKGVEFYCDHQGSFGEYAAKGFGFLKCDDDHKAQEYCKFVDDKKMLFEMICCLAEDQRKEAFDMAISCFQTKDHNNGQSCLERFGKWITSLKEVAEMIANKGS